MSPKRKEVSSNFAIFLVIFLILSTVTVFAVLLVLSYETNFNGMISEKERNATEFSSSLANSMSQMITYSDGGYIYGTDSEVDDNLVDMAESRVFKNYGYVYLYTGHSDLIYTDSPEGRENDDYIREAFTILVANSRTHGSQKSTLKRDDRTIFLSVNRVNGSNVYCCYASEFIYKDAFRDYMSKFLLPVGVSFGFAIIFFIVAVWILLGPIREFSRVIGHASNGDYTARVNEKYLSTRSGYFSLTSDVAMMGNTINSMVEKLDNEEKDRSVFISSIAHDIRTPVTSIKGFATAMIDGVIEHDQYPKYLQNIRQQSDRIGKLVNSMTEASSLKKVDPELTEAFDAVEMINDIIDNLAPQVGDKNINLHAVYADKPKKLIAFGDAQQLCRVIQNTVSNAIKFTPEDGEIIVSAIDNPSESNILISVEDSGPGIPPEKQNRVFESFYKVDSSRKVEGFGLGLYICKQILAGHGQTISVTNGDILGGAKFTFTFPYPPQKE